MTGDCSLINVIKFVSSYYSHKYQLLPEANLFLFCLQVHIFDKKLRIFTDVGAKQLLRTI